MSEQSTRVCPTCRDSAPAELFFCRRCAEPLRTVSPSQGLGQQSSFGAWPDGERNDFEIALRNFHRIYLWPVRVFFKKRAQYELCSKCRTPVHESDAICPTCGAHFADLYSTGSIPMLMLSRRLRVEWNSRESKGWLQGDVPDLADTARVQAFLSRRAAKAEVALRKFGDEVAEHWNEYKAGARLQGQIKEATMNRVLDGIPGLTQDARSRAAVEGFVDDVSHRAMETLAEAHDAALRGRNWAMYYDFPVVRAKDPRWSELTDDERSRAASVVRQMRYWRETPHWVGLVGFGVVLVAASVLATVRTEFFDAAVLAGGLSGLILVACLSVVVTARYSEASAESVIKATRAMSWLSVVGSVAVSGAIYSFVWALVAMLGWYLISWGVTLVARLATWKTRMGMWELAHGV